MKRKRRTQYSKRLPSSNEESSYPLTLIEYKLSDYDYYIWCAYCR